jgi:hypothetical protein
MPAWACNGEAAGEIFGEADEGSLAPRFPAAII